MFFLSPLWQLPNAVFGFFGCKDEKLTDKLFLWFFYKIVHEIFTSYDFLFNSCKSLNMFLNFI